MRLIGIELGNGEALDFFKDFPSDVSRKNWLRHESLEIHAHRGDSPKSNEQHNSAITVDSIHTFANNTVVNDFCHVVG